MDHFRMRLLFAVLFLGVVYAQQQAKFNTKFQNLVTNYLGANTNKALDLVAADIYADKNFTEICNHLMDQMLSLVPASKYLPALGMFTSLQSCYKKCGSSIEKGMDAMAFALNKQLTPLFKKVTDKVRTMKKNKKTQLQCYNEGFKIAIAGLTKALVQNVINNAMSKSTKEEYKCASDPMNQVLQVKNYNLEYKASG